MQLYDKKITAIYNYGINNMMIKNERENREQREIFRLVGAELEFRVEGRMQNDKPGLAHLRGAETMRITAQKRFSISKKLNAGYNIVRFPYPFCHAQTDWKT